MELTEAVTQRIKSATCTFSLTETSVDNLIHNCLALDLLLADQWGVCVVLNLPCYTYISTSSQVVTNVQDSTQRPPVYISYQLLDQSLLPPLDLDHAFFGPLFVTILSSLIFGGFCCNCIARFNAHCIRAFKLQMVLQMEPQMSLFAGVLWQHRGPIPRAGLGSTPPKHSQLEAARTGYCFSTPGNCKCHLWDGALREF